MKSFESYFDLTIQRKSNRSTWAPGSYEMLGLGKFANLEEGRAY